MATTSHLGLTLLEQAQAQKDVTVNEALARIDAVLNTGALSASLATPPVSPLEGDVYIVAASATDGWSGKDGQIAYFDGGIWRFIVPRAGMQLWLAAESQFYVYSGSVWQAETDVTRGYNQSQYHALKTIADAATIDWDVRTYTHAEVTLGGNRTLAAPQYAEAGGIYRLIVRQDGAGGHTLSFAAAYHFPGGSAPTISSAANAVDVLEFFYDGSAMLGLARQDVR